MSRLFVKASSQKMEATAAQISGYPFSFSVWINPVTMAATQTALSVGHGTNAAQYFALGTLSTAHAFFESANSTTNDITGTATLTTGTWVHLAIVAVSTANITLYTNGVSDGSTSTAKTPTGFNVTDIGGLNSGGVSSSFFDGLIAHAAIWNVALNTDEVKLLAKGSSPLRIRPASRVNYCIVGGLSSPEPDQDKPTTYTVTGATQGSSNPPMSQFNNNYQFVAGSSGDAGLLSFTERIR